MDKKIKLYRACNCYSKHCRHNPPDGMIAVTRKKHLGVWFLKEDMGFVERMYRKYIQDYNI